MGIHGSIHDYGYCWIHIISLGLSRGGLHLVWDLTLNGPKYPSIDDNLCNGLGFRIFFEGLFL